jgi:hypothetical protein
VAPTAAVSVLESALRRLCADLRAARIKFALVGGLAVSVRTEPRFASSGIEGEIVEEAELLEVLRELSIPVARTGHLIALKILSRDDEIRPQDVVDLRALTKKASREEIARARKALKLIESRGFQRGRPLLKLLEDFRKSRS